MQFIVVDSDPDHRTHLCLTLEKNGHRALLCASAFVARDFLRDERCRDMVLCELAAPGIDGLSLLANIRRENASKYLPVALFSDQWDQQLIQHALKLGASAVLSKPVSGHTLIQKIEEMKRSLPRPILIVDNCARLAGILQSILRREGLRSDIVESGPKALEYIEQRRPQLVISEVYMLEMSGFDLLEQIKTRYDDTSVVLMAGKGKFGKQSALAAGADGFISKPFKNIEIAMLLSPLLQLPRFSM
ncbi:MAG TPA: response regulator [candidate division Zixibacteria bacterium]|nr:response regulator [candidate division Zixibacteria bacterium]